MKLMKLCESSLKHDNAGPNYKAMKIVTFAVLTILSYQNHFASSSSTTKGDIEKPHHQKHKSKISDHSLDEVEFHRHHQMPLGIDHLTRTNEVNTGLQQPVTRNKLCANAMRELDRCSSQLIGLGHQDDNQAAFPDSMQELNSVYCPKFRETVSCIKNQTSCFKPFERQVINWILSSTKKMTYKRCKNENEKFRFLKLTNSCLSTMKNPMDNCTGHYIGSLDAIALYFDFNRSDRGLEFERLQEAGGDIEIQLACCANRRFKRCIMNGAERMCKPNERLRKLRRTNSNSSQRVARKQLIRSMQDTMNDLKTTLDEMSLTGPEFICNNVDEKFCSSKFDGHYTGRVSGHRSIVPAMIKIYANK